MNARRLAIRKMIYFALVALLLFPLVHVGAPATGPSSGGQLAQVRAEHQLGQTQLGEVDLAGESIRLGSLGLHGIASLALWNQVHEYRKTENWPALETTLNQLVSLTPNYVNIWKFQAHNLSFNLAAEVDDYRRKYVWVKKGIDFLKRGHQYNQNDPRMLYDIGWFTCQKIGNSDERKQFRRMYYDEEQRDNWLAGKEWFLRAQRLVDDSGRPFPGMSQPVFHWHPAMAQIYFAKALEEDGLPDPDATMTPAAQKAAAEKAAAAWQQAWRTAAYDLWEGPESFGERAFDIGQAMTVRANELDEQSKRLDDAVERLVAIVPDQVERLLKERQDELLDEEREAIKVAPEARSGVQKEWVRSALARLLLLHQLAEQAPPDRQIEARRLADDGRLAHFKAEAIERLREPVNFESWKVRCRAEAHELGLAARLRLDEARRARRQGRLAPAKELFLQAFDNWHALAEVMPAVRENLGLADEMLDA
ncbi:MAG: hypothetical protein WD176_04780, partial [Pirellulales bacterium]